MAASKSLSDNSSRCVILVLGSVDRLFSFKLRFFCFLVWWVIFGCILNILGIWDFFKICFSRQPLMPPHWEKGVWSCYCQVGWKSRFPSWLLLTSWGLERMTSQKPLRCGVAGWSPHYHWTVLKVLTLHQASSDTTMVCACVCACVHADFLWTKFIFQSYILILYLISHLRGSPKPSAALSLILRRTLDFKHYINLYRK